MDLICSCYFSSSFYKTQDSNWRAEHGEKDDSDIAQYIHIINRYRKKNTNIDHKTIYWKVPIKHFT